MIGKIQFEPKQLLRAFTLIELLVVIAIIAILAGLLLPSLVRAKQKAQQAACGNQLKQVGYAIEMYASDNDGRLPGPINREISSSYSTAEQPTLLSFLWSYVGLPRPVSASKTGSIMICPAVKSTPTNSGGYYVACLTVTNSISPLNQLSNVFGLAQRNDFMPVKLAEIKMPSGNWALTDMDQSNRVDKGQSSSPLPSNKAHGRKRNQVYFDWHVQAVE